MESAADRIAREVSSWPDVTATPHRFGGLEFRVGRREIGHMHGSRLVDLPFPRAIRDELVAAGRAVAHHVMPDSGWVSFYMRTPEDTDAAIELLRMNYERRWRHDHNEDLIDEASEDSFPASDPPSFGPITGIGHESSSDD